MKKWICLLLTAVLLLSLCACGGTAADQKTAPEPTQEPVQAVKEWTRQGFFADENGNFASVTWMDDVDEPGWYAAFMIGEDPVEDSYSGMVQQDGSALRGTLSSGGSAGDLTVAISEDGEDGVVFAVEGGETYRFTHMEMEEPLATLWVNTEGYGFFTSFAEGEEPDDTPWTSMQEGVAEPKTFTLTAVPGDGWFFVKWTLNGEEYSQDEQITLEVSEDTDLVAVFEFAEDGQNPVMNFIGPYVCDRARALVEADGSDGARITIKWGSSAWELGRWVIAGPFDADTLTVDYTDCVMSVLTYGDDGELKSEAVEYENGTGRIVFDGAGSFTWHDDMSERDDMVFEWSWDPGAMTDLGESGLYTREELQDAAAAIQDKFAEFEGCELHSIRYAGDEANNAENLAWLNSLADGAEYTQIAEFLMDFHSPVEDGPYAWEPDTEYLDYQWWLARSADGAWEVVSWGY